LDYVVTAPRAMICQFAAAGKHVTERRFTRKRGDAEVVLVFSASPRLRVITLSEIIDRLRNAEARLDQS
jgi:hypothetical protein